MGTPPRGPRYQLRGSNPNIMPSSRLGCPLSLKTPNMGNPGVQLSVPAVDMLDASLHNTALNLLSIREAVCRITRKKIEQLRRPASASILFTDVDSYHLAVIQSDAEA